MLIKLRDKKNKLVIKDILDIDFDMSVEEKYNKYYVSVNRIYRCSEEFPTETDAENRMTELADIRNRLESELRDYF